MLQCSRRLMDEALESRLYPPSALAREEARAAPGLHLPDLVLVSPEALTAPRWRVSFGQVLGELCQRASQVHVLNGTKRLQQS